ncbi:hypothetical protein FSP39_007233 [Pinctada imbricata]|uniref:Uncharacterized protein n=1 Tax=Pinctada imbricata TaxID=66713 RepID=A0AA88XKS0_PINIB|nr:hypothetical protein FSP39_007233 [Pinctada imbricata]
MGGSSSFPMISIPRNRVFVVTGGNSGIGYETSKWIAMMGGHVIIACRSEIRAKEAIEKMRTDFAEEKSKGTKGVITEGEIIVEFMQLDLASLSSVMAFIEAFKASGKKLHVLLCNAGLVHELEFTEDENELMFQVNYLSHLLITIKLFPIIQNSGEDLRIVNNSSLAHGYTNFNMDNIQGKKESFHAWDYYSKSKGYQILQMYTMNRKLQRKGVSINCINPGIVESPFHRAHPRGWMSCAISCSSGCGCTNAQSEGGAALIDAAVNPKYEGRGDLYISELKVKSTKAYTRKRENQEALWKYSMEKLSKYLTEEDMAIFDHEK